MANHLHLMVNAEGDATYFAATEHFDTLDIAMLEHEAQDWLNGLVPAIGMKAVFPARAAYVREPGNAGLTASINIETSHIAFHVWDEPRPAKIQFDLYTCGTLDVDYVLQEISQRFEIVTGTWMLLNREDGFSIAGQGTFPL